ncbi:hypothetical protein M5D96_007546 [Drosophila gunungcola]|uniref:Uncharacterized protein n=1 Tax=Drosophila gunungcola TaxID=103775 RepID=A0A9Q0BQ55_9MUSC|nr:hypothetical protein M5D96_007546 [Drosophila gunungcola]
MWLCQHSHGKGIGIAVAVGAFQRLVVSLCLGGSLVPVEHRQDEYGAGEQHQKSSAQRHSQGHLIEIT